MTHMRNVRQLKASFGNVNPPYWWIGMIRRLCYMISSTAATITTWGLIVKKKHNCQQSSSFLPRLGYESLSTSISLYCRVISSPVHIYWIDGTTITGWFYCYYFANTNKQHTIFSNQLLSPIKDVCAGFFLTNGMQQLVFSAGKSKVNHFLKQSTKHLLNVCNTMFSPL